MKLLSSFKKELILATRSFYFYIEIAFALVLLAVLLFAIPEHSQMKETRYLHLDLPQQAADFVRDSLLWEDTDGKMDKVTLEAGGQEYAAELVEKEALLFPHALNAKVIARAAVSKKNFTGKRREFQFIFCSLSINAFILFLVAAKSNRIYQKYTSIHSRRQGLLF